MDDATAGLTELLNYSTDMNTSMNMTVAVVTTMNMSTRIIITTMITNITITSMMKNAAVDVDMTMITPTIIMQMKYLQAGAKKHLRNIIRKNWIQSYRNYPKMSAMV